MYNMKNFLENHSTMAENIEITCTHEKNKFKTISRIVFILHKFFNKEVLKLYFCFLIYVPSQNI